MLPLLFQGKCIGKGNLRPFMVFTSMIGVGDELNLSSNQIICTKQLIRLPHIPVPVYMIMVLLLWPTMRKHVT